MNNAHCPQCTSPLKETGFTGYGTTIFYCPQCKGVFEIKVNKEPVKPIHKDKVRTLDTLDIHIQGVRHQIQFLWDVKEHVMFVALVEMAERDGRVLPIILDGVNVPAKPEPVAFSKDGGATWEAVPGKDALGAAIARAEKAEARAAGLEYWKESALARLNSINLQAVAKELGLKLGLDIGPAILSGIQSLKARVAELEEQRRWKIELLKETKGAFEDSLAIARREGAEAGIKWGTFARQDFDEPLEQRVTRGLRVVMGEQ